MSKRSNIDGYVTVKVAADMLDYGDSYIRRLIAQGELDAIDVNPRLKLVDVRSIQSFRAKYPTRRRRRAHEPVGE